jgi:hypothetical protein
MRYAPRRRRAALVWPRAGYFLSEIDRRSELVEPGLKLVGGRSEILDHGRRTDSQRVRQAFLMRGCPFSHELRGILCARERVPECIFEANTGLMAGELSAKGFAVQPHQ